MPREIVLADPTTDETYIRFQLLRTPDPYPEYEYPTNFVQAHQMRTNAESAGIRVLSYAGITPNHWDISFTLHLVLPAEAQQIYTWFAARPPVIKFSLDGLDFYWAAFQADGLAVTGYKNNEDYDLAQPFHNMCAIKLHILQACDAPDAYLIERAEEDY